MFVFERGYSVERRAPTAAISRFAASTAMPGFTRPTALMKCEPRLSGSSIHGSNTNGVQRSGAPVVPGYVNVGGATPMIVYASLLSEIELPITCGFATNLLRQSLSDST